ncbi:MAG: hypothetical protein ACTHK9_02495 [Nitrobacter sp.]|jgi:hypothetical protein
MSNTQLGDASYVKTKLYYNTFCSLLSAYDDISYTTQSNNGRFDSYYDDNARRFGRGRHRPDPDEHAEGGVPRAASRICSIRITNWHGACRSRAHILCEGPDNLLICAAVAARRCAPGPRRASFLCFPGPSSLDHLRGLHGLNDVAARRPTL